MAPTSIRNINMPEITTLISLVLSNALYYRRPTLQHSKATKLSGPNLKRSREGAIQNIGEVTLGMTELNLSIWTNN